MHTRRLLTFLLGVWAALLLATGAVTAVGLHVATAAAKAPPSEPSRALYVIGEATTERLFRYVAMEICRWLYETGGLLELGLLFAVASMLFLQNSSRPAIVVSAMMLVAAVASHFLLTPQVVAQGRMLDFRPVETMLGERARLVRVQWFYGLLALFRLGCGAAITGILLHRKSRRRDGNIHGVDYTEDSHIDR